MSGARVTTVTVFTFSRGERMWAFGQMAFARPLLRSVQGLAFHKLMGAGRGVGFTLQPDWARYAFLGVWETEDAAQDFLRHSVFVKRYRNHAERMHTLLLSPLTSHGAWNGQNPFGDGGAVREGHTGRIAVLTRATIRLSRLRAFWQQVAPVRRELEGAAGLLSSIGVGEAPFIRQATLSVWENEEAMKAFAYGARKHREVVERTRKERWYSEDLFARFAVLGDVTVPGEQDEPTG